MSRPEHQAPPEEFYNDVEAAKYTSSSRIVQIQAELAERAIELLNLPPGPHYILDIGCGSGLSGEALERAGHAWVGFDISPSMLAVAQQRGCGGDTLQKDMGQPLPFRSGVFDGAISISAVQWLCYSDKAGHTASRRLQAFFSSLYNSLKRGSRAVLQLYPESPEQLALITNCAMKCGFSGGVVVDFPNSSKAQKHYLCLFAGYDRSQRVPQALGVGEDAGATVGFQVRDRYKRSRRKKERSSIRSREWVQNKKDRQRRQGKKVKRDSKYTARRRPAPF